MGYGQPSIKKNKYSTVSNFRFVLRYQVLFLRIPHTLLKNRLDISCMENDMNVWFATYLIHIPLSTSHGLKAYISFYDENS